ncbi:MAG: helix-turn-helix domain-containing protein [Marinobacter sp.]|nr:helix-turn-helix domain-containing protein [Marinobacter sp.]
MTQRSPRSDRLSYQLPILSARYARRFARFMERRGIGRKALLGGLGIDESMLNNPDVFLTMDQVIAILKSAQALATDERLPFQFGQQLDFPAHGLLGYALLRHQSQYKLTTMIVQYLRVSLPIMDMEVDSTGQQIEIVLRDTWDLQDVRSFVAKIYMGSIYSLASQVCHRMRFECDFGSTLQVDCWQKIARCADLRFGCGHNRVIMPVSDRSERVAAPDARYILAKAESRQQLQPDNVRALVAQVREIISYNPDRRSTLERVAHKLGMSPRSLRGHLTRAGTSFREIRNEIREAYATRYLTDTSVSLDIIAEKVGFSDQAGFTRAYRSWTGTTPGEVRRKSRSSCG